MKDKKKLVAFFDNHSGCWDNCHSEQTFSAIEKIFSRIDFMIDDNILDVGAGTGILVPFFDKKGIKKTTAIDISSGMVEAYKKKFPGKEIICADYEEYLFSEVRFDKIIIFNTFPHFSDYAKVFKNSYNHLKDGGLLVIAHSKSRKELNCHHEKKGRSKDILISDKELRNYYEKAGFFEIIVEDGDYFYSCGKKSEFLR